MAIRRTIAEFSDDIATADIADDAITGGKLANDIAISTTGAIAGTGGLTMDGATVFNEASADVDFRVESNGNANMLFVDAGNDRVGIGTGAPGFPLDVQGTGGGGVASFYSTDLSDTDHTHIKIGKSATANEFAVVGFRKMASTADYAYFAVNNAPTGANMVIDVAGNVGIGTVAPDAPLHIMATDTTHGISSAADNFIIEDDAAVGMTFASNNDMTIAFSDNYQSENCKIFYDQSEQALSFWTDELRRLTIDQAGKMAINGTINSAITLTLIGHTQDSAGYTFYALNGASTATLMFLRNDNLAYFGGEVSALSFTDRTPYPETTQLAYDVLNSHQRLPDGEYDSEDISSQLNHSNLHEYVSHVEPATFWKDTDELPEGISVGDVQMEEVKSRNVSGVVSCLVEVIKDILEKNTALEARVLTLESA